MSIGIALLGAGVFAKKGELDVSNITAMVPVYLL
jgi:hypothetical protein